jgi:hypothetical protein
MKKLLIGSMVAGLLMGAPVVYADDAHHPDQQGQTSKTPASAEGNSAMQKMQENMKKMRAQLDKIQKTKDPELRQKLMMEYMQTMHDNMMMGRQMMMGACSMKEGEMRVPMMHGMMDEGEAGMSPDAMMDRMNRMEKRMDMMQMMMEQMSKSQPAKQ